MSLLYLASYILKYLYLWKHGKGTRGYPTNHQDWGGGGGIYHAFIHSRVNGFTFLILIKLDGWAHWSLHCLGFLYVVLLRRSLIYFAWLMKVPFFSCLIWSPRKKLSSLIMFISNSLCMHLENSSQRETLVAPKIISSTKSISFSLVFMKRVLKTSYYSVPMP